MRIVVKGGVWRNTEDEVLKAAVSKYGTKASWARIASLFTRKSAAQCKQRWYEWLDPAIKKTEWSRDEDEKLLHLAKIMPTQWRTIAPIVGRTANQCIQRYGQLLDDAEAEDDLAMQGTSGAEGRPAEGPQADLGKMTAEIAPESLPAKPDAIDLDEDEKEMLSEARARLANTQGKKAKRKARERQLEVARRLAQLQKQRELKAAGIFTKPRKKLKGMDYNADIPFEKKPALGFYDTTAEVTKVVPKIRGRDQNQMDAKRKAEEDEFEKKKKARQDGVVIPGFVASKDAQLQKLRQQREQAVRRKKLDLPEPQVGESDLEEIAKLGQVGNLRGNELTSDLVGEYDPVAAATHARTPLARQDRTKDRLLVEARHLRDLTASQTPLLGQENLDVTDGGLGYERRTQPTATPNLLARTDRSLVTRDSMALNTPKVAGPDTKNDLRAKLASLPQPQNEIEFVLEDEIDEPAQEVVLSEEDAAERDARVAAQKAEEEARALARRSQVVQRGLPRPANFSASLTIQSLARDKELSTADRLVLTEMARLVEHDSIAYPMPGTRTTGIASSQAHRLLEAFVDDELAAAKKSVQRELALGLQLPGDASAAAIAFRLAQTADLDGDAVDEYIAALEQELYVPSLKQALPRDSLNEAQLIEALRHDLARKRSDVARQADASAKMESRATKLLAGFQMRASKLEKQMLDAWNQADEAHRSLNSFRQLWETEKDAIPRRIEKKEKEVKSLEVHLSDLQSQYGNIEARHKELVETVDILRGEKLLREAEAVNEAALAAE